MKNSTHAAFAMTLALAAFASPATASPGKKAGAAVLMSTGDLKWNDVPGNPGVKMVILDGDPASGATHFLIKLQDGFSAPLHHHSSDHYVTVLSGALILTVDGKETTLPAGSFFSFTGKLKHLTRCAPGADCVLSVDARGKWDVVPETAIAAKHQ